MSYYIPWLVDTIKNNPELTTIAEVGVFQGESLCKYAPSVKERNGKIYAIDWFQGNIHEVYQGSEMKQLHYFRTEQSEIDKIYQSLIDDLIKIDCLDIVVILRGDSSQMADEIPDKSLDLCFIDGDHTYEGVCKDITAYQNKVKDDGILSGHDYDQPEVRRAVDEYLTCNEESDPTALVWRCK